MFYLLRRCQECRLIFCKYSSFAPAIARTLFKGMVHSQGYFGDSCKCLPVEKLNSLSQIIYQTWCAASCSSLASISIPDGSGGNSCTSFQFH